jgi:hypothetical protein
MRSIGATAVANFALAGGNLKEMEDNFRKAWENGNLHWLDADITPIYKMFGGTETNRRYFSLMRQFKDPINWAFSPIRSIHNKGSVASRVVQEALSGTDWTGRRFTTLQEFLKSGGQKVKWGPGRPIAWDQFPSYLLSQLSSLQPVQLQTLISAAAGEEEAFETVARSMGLYVAVGRKAK